MKKAPKVTVEMPCGHTITVPDTKPELTPLKVDESVMVRTTLIHLLDRLGKTTSDWRKQLFREEVKALRSTPAACAIAVYLNNHIPGYRAAVGGSEIQMTNRVTGKFYMVPSGGLGGHARTLSAFVRHFDKAAYPELLA